MKVTSGSGETGGTSKIQIALANTPPSKVSTVTGVVAKVTQQIKESINKATAKKEAAKATASPARAKEVTALEKVSFMSRVWKFIMGLFKKK